jgi:hypothetical protein
VSGVLYVPTEKCLRVCSCRIAAVSLFEGLNKRQDREEVVQLVVGHRAVTMQGVKIDQTWMYCGCG